MTRVSCAFAIILSTLVWCAKAQDSLFYSGNFRFSKNMAVASCVQPIPEGFLLIESTQEKNPKIHVVAYDKNGGLVNEFNHTLTCDSEFDLAVDRIIPYDSTTYIFLSGYDKKEKMQRAYVAILRENGRVVEQPKLIFSSPNDFSGNLQLSFSPNKKNFALYFETGTFRKAEVPVHFKILDSEFNTIRDKELFLPYGAEVVQVQQCLVDDSANVFLVSGKNPVKNNVRVMRSQGGRYLVFYYNFKENKLKEYDISLKEKQVVAAQGAINSNNEMIVAGYYSNDFSFAVAGTFVFKIATGGGALKSASYMAFPKDFLTQIIGNRETERYPELSDYFLDHMILQPNGSILIIGEQYSISERVNMDPVTGRTIVENLHHYDDIIIHSLEESGKINWSGFIPKAQHTSLDRDKCGYNFFIQPDKINFYFNDHPDNFKVLQQNPRARVDSWNGSKSAVITEVSFDFSGKNSRKNLISHKAAGGVLLPGLSNEQIRGNIILGLSQNKDYKFCILR